MNILVTVDSFKDCMSSKAAGESVRKGILLNEGSFDVRVIPMADGGEGTAEALMDARGGRVVACKVYDPLMREIDSSFIILDDEITAVIEMARASGIELLTDRERNPWVTTSFGTGQLITEALNRGCKRIILAIGGSATNDAGVGMLLALGIKFFDKNGKMIGPGGGELDKIEKIDTSTLDIRLSSTDIIVACDVTNPLTGPTGASFIYAPQKGADRNMVEKLDDNLRHVARLFKQQTGKDVEKIPGAGAAGGLGAGLLAFTGAIIQSGFEVISKENDFENHIQWADLIITGEGKIDSQTQFGKTPAGVAKVAKKYGKPVIAIAGTLGEGYMELYPLGFDAICSFIDKPMSLHEAIIKAPQLLERCAYNIVRLAIKCIVS